VHLNATNVQELIEPQGGKSVVELLQNNINAVIAQRKRTGVPMIVHINHPNFHYSISLEDMILLTGERFFEIYNGHYLVHNLGDSIHISTEEMWDLINIAYLKKAQPLLYGLATDDSHHYHRIDTIFANAGRGWIQVQADDLNAESLIESMEAGRFYASTGVALKAIDFERNLLSIEVLPEPGIDYEIEFIGCNKGDDQTKVLKRVKGRQASFQLNEKNLFVRAKVISSKMPENPIEGMTEEMAWTQPVIYEKK
jgi:hypothetical protein